MSNCRKLAIGANAHLSTVAPAGARRLLELAASFPASLANRCLCLEGEGCIVKALVAGSEDGAAAMLSVLPPSKLCLEMHRAINSGIDTDHEVTYKTLQRLELCGIVQQLVDALSGCERILLTPVPLSYSRHTSRFLSIWSFTLVFALADVLGLATLPVVAIICWCLFAIEEIGNMIEQPFDLESARPYNSGLPVDALAAEIRAEVESIAADLHVTSGADPHHEAFSMVQMPTGFADLR